MWPALLRHAGPSTIALLSATFLASCLAAASNAPAARSPAADAGPSHLDYMMLASMADSPHLLAMAAYHPSGDDAAPRWADPGTPHPP